MGAPFQNTQVPGWYRFLIGKFECTVVWDGYIHHAYDGIYPNGDPAEIRRLQEMYHLPFDHIPMDLNPVVVNTGEQLMLIDTGMGVSSDLFGDTMGRMQDNMRAAGIDPSEIDVILITHLHPDHSFGLLNPDGSPVYPNAQLCVAQPDWDEWTDESVTNRNDFRGVWTKGTIESVAPYRDRLRLFEPGERLFESVTSVPAIGHSLGQCAFLFESEGERVIFTGDLAHHHILDPYHPEWFFHNDYDSDPPLGAKAKSEVFAKVVDEDIRIHGYHFPYPGLGVMTREGDGTYRYHADTLTPRLGAGRFGTG